VSHAFDPMHPVGSSPEDSVNSSKSKLALIAA
jgi:hypothetical protein